MNTLLRRNLLVVAAASFTCKLFSIHPFQFRNVFSTEAHSQTLFSQFAFIKQNFSEADITRMLRLQPGLKKLDTLQKVEGIIHSLKKYGCTEAQIVNMLRSQPQLARIAKNTVEPKLQLLEDFGFVDRNLTKFLTKNACLLTLDLENNLLPKMEFLKNVFQSQQLLVKALLKSRRLLNYSLEKVLKPSVAFWEGWGFSGAALVSFLQIYPLVLTRTSLTPAQADLINKIGADKTRNQYKYIVAKVALSRTETLEAKIDNLKLCGLSAEESWQLVRAVPAVFGLSKENVSEKMNFLVNNMNLPANYVVKHPFFLLINLEMTIRPRFLVWQKMKSINASELPLSTLLRMPETRFVKNIIKGHADSKILWRIYESAISNPSNCTDSSTNKNSDK